jgi:hypothetical protein
MPESSQFGTHEHESKFWCLAATRRSSRSAPLKWHAWTDRRLKNTLKIQKCYSNHNKQQYKKPTLRVNSIASNASLIENVRHVQCLIPLGIPADKADSDVAASNFNNLNQSFDESGRMQIRANEKKNTLAGTHLPCRSCTSSRSFS